ncbi:hypothetical protein [Bacillus sp. SH8-8]|uniref:hypothetical protein n=1 Tax=Bacillus sp. SH8-8 TaxID=2217830 RepID=UPI0034D580FD
MPPEENESNDWKELIVQMAVDYALPAAGEAIYGLITNHFNPQQRNMEFMFRNAIEEICRRVDEIVEDNFLREYLSDCTHIANQLYIYGTTKDINIIRDIQVESSRLALRLFDLGYKASGGFFLASNVHLISLRSLSNIDSSYTRILSDFTNRYAQMGDNLNLGLTNRGKSFEPSECKVNESWINLSGDSDAERAAREHYKRLTNDENIPERAKSLFISLFHGLNQSERTFFPNDYTLLAIDTRNVELTKNACEEQRSQIYNNKAQPIHEIVERTQAVVNQWNNWVM